VDSKTTRVNILVQAKSDAIFKADAVVLAAIIQKRPVEEVTVVTGGA
jgi:hypothetical protein